jgi:hypothetical protein
MRKILFIALVTVSLAGCKRDEAREDELTPPRETVPAQTQRGTVDTDRDDSFRAELRSRLDRIDARLDELRARGDEESRRAADRLRVRRDQLAETLDRAGDRTRAGWDEFKADAQRSFDALERDLDEAFTPR